MKKFASIVSLLFLIVIVNADYFTVFHNKDTDKYEVKKGKNTESQDWVAWSKFDDTVNETGWAKLIVTTNKDQDEYLQMYGAGFLEGTITWNRIWQAWVNFEADAFDGGHPSKYLKKFVVENISWMKSKISENNKKPASDQDPYWNHVELVLAQLEGLSTAYNENAPEHKQLSLEDQWLQNSNGDLEELIPATDPDFKKNSENIPDYLSRTHCSALIKPTPGNTELFSGHTTWNGYTYMLRIYKIYNFYIDVHGTTSAKSISFSAYPATLSSIDDFYITSSGLSVTETTNGILNNSLLDKITPSSIVSWIRAMVANRMARNGKEWTQIFARYNSGTYNNQWMITDYNLFKSGEEKLAPNTLWVLEQIPGKVESADMTDYLNNQGYWPSYNIPFFPSIYNLSGFAAAERKHGTPFSYTKCPRAKIFKREQSRIHSLDDYKFTLRFNEWQTDPLSLGDAANAIASRYDLSKSDQAGPFGGIDSKVTSYEFIEQFKSVGISGPTYYQQPVFEWTEEWSSYPHEGVPFRFDFDWEEFHNEL